MISIKRGIYLYMSIKNYFENHFAATTMIWNHRNMQQKIRESKKGNGQLGYTCNNEIRKKKGNGQLGYTWSQNSSLDEKRGNGIGTLLQDNDNQNNQEGGTKNVGSPKRTGITIS
jgi:hypothetical protein